MESMIDADDVGLDNVRNYPYSTVCCAICGTYLTSNTVSIYAETNASSNEIDFLAGREDETSWLGRALVVGSNPSSEKPLHVWSSKTDDRFPIEGSYFVLPEATLEALGIPAPLRMFRIFSRVYGRPFIIPMHDECHYMLSRYLGEQVPDPEVLHDTLAGLALDSDDFSLRDLAISYAQSDYSCALGDNEFLSKYKHLALSPVNIPELDRYYKDLPKPGRWSTFLLPSPSRLAKHKDPFRRLPPELTLMVSDYLDVNSLINWRAASQVALRVVLTNGFWRRRVQWEMPWLYDLSELWCGEDADAVAWAQLFREMRRATKAEGPDCMHALRNRKYIWLMQCRMIAGSYLFKKASKNVAFRRLMPQLEKATVVRTACMTRPRPVKSSSYSVTFVNAMSDLAKMEPTLVMSWTENGELHSIDVLKDNHMEQTDHLFIDDHVFAGGIAKQDYVLVPADDWITGFAFSVRDEAFEQHPSCHGGLIVMRHVDDEWDRELISMDIPDDGIAFGPTKTFELGRLQRVITGVEVRFAKSPPTWLGHYTWENHSVSVAEGHFAVGLTMNRETKTTTVADVGIVQIPLEDYPSIRRLVDEWT
ncbi:hypothetical protein RJ55_06508 [Drechmeria coniospora]|nr:hypothetical protein RJ55_06508 [Drechmeria coniospora]